MPPVHRYHEKDYAVAMRTTRHDDMRLLTTKLLAGRSQGD